ncbi:MAG: CoA-binding protein, partial [Chloroflexi bacterium]|nr:CoA-binding protein [Chloroflexota bacterium]
MSTHQLEEILHPQSIAVVGASGVAGTQGYIFVSALLKAEFKGNIYPVNPKYSEIAGLKAYPTLTEIPTPVDFVISNVPAPEVPAMLEGCARKGVKAVHLYTARFSETGRQEAAELEKQILKQAKAAGIRLIGPNCMGVYYPKHGISWREDFPKESGTVGLASQSGGHARRIVYLAAVRGVYFSKAISYGNAIDFNESDFLDYFSDDPMTKIILMYVEGVK